MPYLCYCKDMIGEDTPKPRRGRPPKPPGEAMNVTLPAVRLTESDIKAARFYADRRGISLSEYVRRAIEDMNARERSLDI